MAARLHSRRSADHQAPIRQGPSFTATPPATILAKRGGAPGQVARVFVEPQLDRHIQSVRKLVLNLLGDGQHGRHMPAPQRFSLRCSVGAVAENSAGLTRRARRPCGRMFLFRQAHHGLGRLRTQAVRFPIGFAGRRRLTFGPTGRLSFRAITPLRVPSICRFSGRSAGLCRRRIVAAVLTAPAPFARPAPPVRRQGSARLQPVPSRSGGHTTAQTAPDTGRQDRSPTAGRPIASAVIAG